MTTHSGATSTPSTRTDNRSDLTVSRSDESVGELMADVSRDLSTLMRQEVELAKAEVRESAQRAGKGAGMLGGAGVVGHLALVFFSVAAWWAIGDSIGHGWSALIVAAVWLIVAGVLAMLGRTELKSMTGMSRTADSVKRIPPAVKGEESA